MDAKKNAGVAHRVRRDLLERTLQCPGHGLHDMGEKGGLVAPRPGLWLEVARREIGRVGLDEKPVARDLAHQLEQVPAAALVADPAGDADVQAELEAGAQLVAPAGEAMGDGLLYFERLQDLGKTRMRVPRMQRSEEHTSE